jgi:MerR family transcriptional regulator, thiopeptide resistance regulator
MHETSPNGAITIGELSHRTGLSRSALLYYHRLGLLRAGRRSEANYRLYSPADVERLEDICFYRGMGIPLQQIARLLEHAQNAGPAERILRQRLQTLQREIAARQEQERQIVRLLEQLSTHPRPRPARVGRPSNVSSRGERGKTLNTKEDSMVSKQRWVEIMRAAGFSEQDMLRWHQSFEKLEPQNHEEFLASLGIAPDEIARIRKSSAKP